MRMVRRQLLGRSVYAVGDDVGDGLIDGEGEPVGLMDGEGLTDGDEEVVGVGVGLDVCPACVITNGFLAPGPGCEPPKPMIAPMIARASTVAATPAKYGAIRLKRSRIHSVRRRRSSCSGRRVRVLSHDMNGADAYTDPCHTKSPRRNAVAPPWSARKTAPP